MQCCCWRSVPGRDHIQTSVQPSVLGSYRQCSGVFQNLRLISYNLPVQPPLVVRQLVGSRTILFIHLRLDLQLLSVVAVITRLLSLHRALKLLVAVHVCLHLRQLLLLVSQLTCPGFLFLLDLSQNDLLVMVQVCCLDLSLGRFFLPKAIGIVLLVFLNPCVDLPTLL
jgi:hypothetical protein